jgi:hypothetical protein
MVQHFLEEGFAQSNFYNVIQRQRVLLEQKELKDREKNYKNANINKSSTFNIILTISMEDLSEKPGGNLTYGQVMSFIY